ncbi:MAG: bacterial transcriptional activator domain-containing protein [Pirellulaceae bacterium]|nr:bacterial transcriptional activator domain-containing protein [Pirellulaceae bacterium]
MLEPRRIRRESVPIALKQAQHYRLLGEPALAESICRDIIAVAPENEDAWVTLLLALTDQFDTRQGEAMDHSLRLVDHFASEFRRCYYAGIISERWARAQLRAGLPIEAAEQWIRKAMNAFMQANELAPADDPNPILRWNSCLRLLDQYDLQTASHSPAIASPNRDVDGEYGDDVPLS